MSHSRLVSMYFCAMCHLAYAGCTSRPPPSLPTEEELLQAQIQKCRGEDPFGECKDAATALYHQGRLEEALPYLRIACDERKHAASCSALGDMHLNGWFVPPDPVKARSLYEFSCARNDAPGCASLGLMLLDGLGGPIDTERGVSSLYIGCSPVHNDAVGRACLRYAEMSLDGRLPLNEKTAHDYARAGCLSRNGKACALQGKLLSEGRGVPHANTIDGAALIKQGCDLGDAQACIDYSHTSQGWIDQNRIGTP